MNGASKAEMLSFPFSLFLWEREREREREAEKLEIKIKKRKGEKDRSVGEIKENLGTWGVARTRIEDFGVAFAIIKRIERTITRNISSRLQQVRRFAPAGSTVFTFSFSHDFVSINRIPVHSSVVWIIWNTFAHWHEIARNVVFGGHPNRLSTKLQNFDHLAGIPPSPGLVCLSRNTYSWACCTFRKKYHR